MRKGIATLVKGFDCLVFERSTVGTVGEKEEVKQTDPISKCSPPSERKVNRSVVSDNNCLIKSRHVIYRSTHVTATVQFGCAGKL